MDLVQRRDRRPCESAKDEIAAQYGLRTSSISLIAIRHGVHAQAADPKKVQAASKLIHRGMPCCPSGQRPRSCVEIGVQFEEGIQGLNERIAISSEIILLTDLRYALLGVCQVLADCCL